MRYWLIALFLFLTSNALATELRIADKVTYNVTVAKTAQEKQKGLMFVKEMPKNQGMLFELKDSPLAAMWMKNTYIPLDMLFIDCDFVITDIYQNAKPLSLDKISTDRPFCYVLEINGGQVLKQNIRIGDKVSVLPLP